MVTQNPKINIPNKAHKDPIEKYHRRRTKAFILQRIRDINIYKRLVLALLKKESLSEDETAERIRIENTWEYDDLKIIIHAVVDRQYQSSNEKLDPNQVSQSKEGWGSWMMRGGGLLYAEQPQAPPPTQSTSTPVEKHDRPQLSLKSSEFQVTAELTSNNS